MQLFKFLNRNLKGYRLLVVLAILVAVLQVTSEIIAVQPLKWIPSKAQNPGNDPACYLPFLGLNDQPGLLDVFDTPGHTRGHAIQLGLRLGQRCVSLWPDRGSCTHVPGADEDRAAPDNRAHRWLRLRPLPD